MSRTTDVRTIGTAGPLPAPGSLGANGFPGAIRRLGDTGSPDDIGGQGGL